MFALSIHLDSSLTVLDNSVREFFTRYSSNLTPLLYILCRFDDIFMSVRWLRTIPICGVAVVLKVISYFMSSLNTWVVLLIISGWEILRVLLVSTLLVVHPMKYYSSPIDWVAYSFLMYSIIFINSGLSPISSVPLSYTMTIIVPRSFTWYKRQRSVLYFF